MTALVGIVFGIVAAAVLAPVIWRLAQRYRKETGAYSAGVVLGAMRQESATYDAGDGHGGGDGGGESE